MAQHFSSTKRKEPSNQNSIYNKNTGIFQELKENQTFLGEGKLTEFVTSRPTLKEWLKNFLKKKSK